MSSRRSWRLPSGESCVKIGETSSQISTHNCRTRLTVSDASGAEMELYQQARNEKYLKSISRPCNGFWILTLLKSPHFTSSIILSQISSQICVYPFTLPNI